MQSVWLRSHGSKLTTAVLLLSLVVLSPHLLAPQEPLKEGQRKLQEARAKAKRDYRIFYGLDDPVLDSGDQAMRRVEMRDALVRTILNYPNLDTSDPTAGPGGDAQHSVAAVFAPTDLGRVVRSKARPDALAEQGNSYFKITQKYEPALQSQILNSGGQLTPADVLRMALGVTGGNYTLATLTAHNFLKNVAYIGRDAAEAAQNEHKAHPSYDEDQLVFAPQDEGKKVVEVASKLTNLRGNPGAKDKLGPWYHGFGLLFLDSVTSTAQTQIMESAEHFTRYFNLGGSPRDPEKEAWDDSVVSAIREIHPIIYGGTLVVNAYDSLTDQNIPWAKVKAVREGSDKPGEEFDAATLQRLPAGSYTITVTAPRDPDYKPAVKTGVVVKAGKRVDLSLPMESTFGYLKVTAVEMGTGKPIKESYVGYNGSSSLPGGLSESPNTFKVPAGEYKAFGGVPDKKYTREEIGPVTVVSGKETSIEVPLRRVPTSDPSSGQLWVEVLNGDEVDRTNLSQVAKVIVTTETGGQKRIYNLHPEHVESLPAGRYTVRAESEGYNPASQSNVEVKEGESTRVTLKLSTQSGTLRVTVVDAASGWTLPNVTVKVVNGTWSQSDVAPCTFNLYPDTYNVVVPKTTVNGTEYRAKEIKQIVVKNNQSTPISIALDPVTTSAAVPSTPAVAQPIGSILIEPDYLDMEVGDASVVSAKVFDALGKVIPDASVTWSSTVPGIVRVNSNGQVTAISAGTGRIVASSGKTTASISATIRALPPPEVTLEPERTSVLDGEAVGLVARVRNRENDQVQFAWSTTGGTLIGSGPRVELNTSGINSTAGALAVPVTVIVVVNDGRGGTASSRAVITVSAPKKLSAQLSCGSSLEIVPGEIDRSCGVIVQGWRGNTADRVEVLFPQLQEDGSSLPGKINVFPGNTFAEPSNMFTAGVTDLHNQYEFTFQFSAPSDAPRSSTPIQIIVRQKGSEEVRLSLIVQVLSKGQIAVPGMGTPPPAVTGSGGNICVWRYKLLSETNPLCWHFVSAACDNARYNNPNNGYLLAGSNMNRKEAEDLISSQSQYFSNCAPASEDNREPTPQQVQACNDLASQIQQRLTQCNDSSSRQLWGRFKAQNCDAMLKTSGNVFVDLEASVEKTAQAIAQARNLLQSARSAQRSNDLERARQLAQEARQTAPDCMADEVQSFIDQMQQRADANAGLLQQAEDAVRECNVEEAMNYIFLLDPSQSLSSSERQELQVLRSRINKTIQAHMTLSQLQTELQLSNTPADCQRLLQRLSAAASDANGCYQDMIAGLKDRASQCAKGNPNKDQSSGSGGQAAPANKPLSPPVYLFHVVRDEKPQDYNLSLFVGLPRKDDKGYFLLADSYGGYYHVVGEYSGPYGDTDSLCAVVRGYGRSFVSYYSGNPVINCQKEGPVTRAQVVRSPTGGPAGPASGAPGSGGTSGGGDRQKELDALRKDLERWQERLACLEEGKRKSPFYELDCNGSWMIGSRDGHIENLRKLIREARIKLGLPPTESASASSAGARVGVSPVNTGTAGAGSAGIGFLLLLNLYGNEIWYTPPQGAERPLTSRETIGPGSGLRTGGASQVSFRSPNSTTVTVNQNTHVRVSSGGERGRVVEILNGSVEVHHPEGTPGYDDINIRTPDGSITPRGTRYRVELGSNGTTVQVFEGTVHLSGAYIMKLSTPGHETGKSAPARELDLHAGERALMARGISQVTETRPTSDLPPWMRATNASSTAASPLAQPDPWNNPQVQQLMDRWIRSAIPPSNTPGVVMHYNEWLQPLSQAATSTGNPDHPADWTRYRYVWENRNRYGSTNLCMLGEFLERSLSGKGLEGCQKSLPSWMTASNAAPAVKNSSTQSNDAIEKARIQVARDEEQRRIEIQQREEAQRRQAILQQQEEARRAELQRQAEEAQRLHDQQQAEERRRIQKQQRAEKWKQIQEQLGQTLQTLANPTGTPAPSSSAPNSNGGGNVAANFDGSWNCRTRITDVRTGSRVDMSGIRPGFEATNALSVRRSGGGYVLEDNQTRIPSTYVRGNTIGFSATVDSVNGQRVGEAVSETVDFRLTGDTLAGTGRASISDGSYMAFSLSCLRSKK